jgi:hypothetical protein
VALYDPKIVAVTAQDTYWLGQGMVAGVVYSSQADPVQVGCAIATLHWSRTTPVGTREDLAACSFAIAKIAGSNRNTPTVADLAGIETRLTTWWTAVKPSVSNQWTLVDYTWHFRNAAAARDGPAVKITTLSLPGTSAGNRGADQNACTVTLATASRRHWGRIYLGGCASSTNLDSTYGRWTPTTCDAFATATDTLATNLLTDGYALGVWSKRGLAFLDTYGVHVDNIVDIQRRRRAKQRSYIKVFGH